jgi:hypothetical protein
MSLLARLEAVTVPPARSRRKPNKAKLQGFRFTPLRSRGAPFLPAADGPRYARLEIRRRAPARGKRLRAV